MKNIVLGFIIIIILAAAGVFIYQNQQQKSLTPNPTTSSQNQITFPQGGETFKTGQTITLKWSGGSDPTEIFLVDKSLESQGVSVSLADRVYNLKNTGSYEYTFPYRLPAGSYKFEIGELNSNYFQVSAQSTPTVFCKPNQLQGVVNPQPGAGNIWAQVTLKNISQTSCQIETNPLEVDYPLSVQNIKVTPQAKSASTTLTLSPNQTLYSKLHYPNGPQCSSEPLGVNAALSLQISESDTLTFQPQGSDTLLIQACTNPKEITEVQVWPLSDKPIPQ